MTPNEVPAVVAFLASLLSTGTKGTALHAEGGIVPPIL